MKIFGIESILERLTDVVSDENIGHAEKLAAEVYKTDMLEFIDLGHSFQNKTGALRNSILDSFSNNFAVITAGSSAAWYAGIIEFGSSRSKAFPFFFADQEHRNADVLVAVTETLQGALNGN